MKNITVCVVDDNIELSEVLEIILMSEGFVCLGKFNTAQEAIKNIPALNPDVVLMDINLGIGESGIDCVRELKPIMPSTNFMMCTIYDDDDKIFEALRAGANGYILKKTPPVKMLEAIKELHEGGAPMSNQIAKKVVSIFHQKEHFTIGKEQFSLTKREAEILELLSRGLSYKDIAEVLFLSPDTVKKHVYHVYEKLHVSNRIEAVNLYFGRNNPTI